MKKKNKTVICPRAKIVGKRNWGKEQLVALIPKKISLKLLKINKGSKGGLQYHHKKDECGYILSGKLQINYDSGNSASNGYKLEEELKLYGHLISNIHIKDRLFKGGPVPLGSGIAELKGIKEFILSGFDGIVSFQAFRNEKPINTFKEQYEYFKNL